MTYDAAELARLRERCGNNGAHFDGPAVLALIDALEKAQDELADMEQTTADMLAQQRKHHEGLRAERDSAHALLRLMMDDAAAPICRYERAILKELAQ